MGIDLSKITLNSKDDIEPRAIFNSLLNKSEKYNGYLRDVQSEVLDKWFDLRNKENNLIKMNTGSGKTVVALLILKSCMNELKEKCIYVVPDNYLIEQVISEARDLGISVSTEENDLNFMQGKSILVISIYKLINGKSCFGMRIGNNIDVGTILIDDVHSCLDIAEKQCTLNISRKNNNDLYEKVLKLFEEELDRQNSMNLLKIKDNDYATTPMLVPFWELQKNESKIVDLLLKEKEIFKFQLPLIEDIIKLCHCTISYDRIEISPKCLPIHKITKFKNASRKIYLSATLNDDSGLISNFDVDSETIDKVIVPKKASDIGDRMILNPQALNPEITNEELKEELKNMSNKYRIIVIVPSKMRAKFWEDVADTIYDSTNLNTIQGKNKGLDVVVNRYEGIDLPGEKCRLLVIDGLPSGKTNYSIVKEIYLDNSENIIKSKIQKIEQGMGRGIRSNEDYCGIILMGRDLVHTMYNSKGYEHFSPATLAQFKLSEQISDQLHKKSLNEIIDALKLCLEKDSGWFLLGKSSLNAIVSNDKLKFSNEAKIYRKAFNFALQNDFTKAVSCFNGFEGTTIFKGWMEQEKAEYLNMFSSSDAQILLKKAIQKNIRLIKPIDGIKKQIKIKQMSNQAKNIIDFVKNKKYDGPGYMIYIQNVISDLQLKPSSQDQGAPIKFEKSIYEIGLILGFDSQMPEKEIGDGGPDNFWQTGNNLAMIIECKNGAVVKEISKRDCAQLLSSIQWFENNYKAIDNNYNYVPIIIHTSSKFADDASPNEKIRIMGENEINHLKENIVNFSKEFINDMKNQSKIEELLIFYKLTSDLFVEEYTKKYVK